MSQQERLDMQNEDLTAAEATTFFTHLTEIREVFENSSTQARNDIINMHQLVLSAHERLIETKKRIDSMKSAKAPKADVEEAQKEWNTTSKEGLSHIDVKKLESDFYIVSRALGYAVTKLNEIPAANRSKWSKTSAMYAFDITRHLSSRAGQVLSKAGWMEFGYRTLLEMQNAELKKENQRLLELDNSKGINKPIVPKG